MARNSLYGGYLNRIDDTQSKIPNWVFNSDYGELDKQLQSADNQAWQTEFNRQQAYQNQMQTEEAQQAIEEQQRLEDAFRNNRPTTLREAYATALESAQEAGDVGNILKSLKELEAADKTERDQKFSDIRSAYSLGLIDPELASDYLAAHGQDYRFNPKVFRKKPEEYKREVEVLDPNTGRISKLSWDDALRAQESYGVVINPTNDMREEVQRQLRRREMESQQPQSSGGWLGFFTGGDSRTEPINQAKGDKTRLGPAPGDTVKKIIIERKRGVKG